MMKRLTSNAVASLQPHPTKRLEVLDLELKGLALRVTAPTARAPKGTKSWSLWHRVGKGGKKARLTLGDYPAISLDDARVLASLALSEARAGRDPRHLQEFARPDRTPRAKMVAVLPQPAGKVPTTLAELASYYIANWAKPRKRSWAEDVRNIELHLLGHRLDGTEIEGASRRWSARHLTDKRIKWHSDIAMLLQDVENQRGPGAARALKAVVSKMFNVGAYIGVNDALPLFGKFKPIAPGKPKTRVLSAKEIPIFLRALEDAPISANTRLLLRLMLITGQRGQECRALHAEQLGREEYADDTTGQTYTVPVWKIPGEISKNGLEHWVPLSPLASALLAEAVPTKDGLYFPGEKGGTYSEGALSKAVQRMLESMPVFKGWKEFTPHDLRRTCNKTMGGLGVDDRDRDRVLNHKPATVNRKHYDPGQFLGQKRRALELWAGYLERLLPAPGVVPFRKRA